jgi:predicted DNA-binding transcriptional regulator AlpA
MTKRRTITITEARALAERWEAQYQEHTRTVAIASRFKDAAPDEVIEMWETNRNERGQKLSQFEFTSLVERWLELFGAYPPIEDGNAPDENASPVTTKHEPEPQDDTMLSPRDVARLAGISIRTIDRMVRRGTFPKPMHLSTRRIGWQAHEVKAWINRLDDQRNATRQ